MMGYFLSLKWFMAFEFFLVIRMTLMWFGNVQGNQSADSSPYVSTSLKFSSPSSTKMILLSGSSLSSCFWLASSSHLAKFMRNLSSMISTLCWISYSCRSLTRERKMKDWYFKSQFDTPAKWHSITWFRFTGAYPSWALYKVSQSLIQRTIMIITGGFVRFLSQFTTKEVFPHPSSPVTIKGVFPFPYPYRR